MNYLGLLLSYVLVFVIIGISTLLQKKGVLGDEGARKFIHIGVSNWWILAMLTFDNVWFASIAPVTFIIINYYSYKTNLIKSMERSGNGNLGTVYFPISLLILALLTFGMLTELGLTGNVINTLNNPYIGAVGILVLGYGDGFAAVVGKVYGKKSLINGKSLEGSLTMLVASFIVVLLIALLNGLALPIALLVAFIIGVFATIVELYTPKGLDNLSVPLLSSLLYFICLLLF